MDDQPKNEKDKIRRGEWLMILFTFGIFATGLIAALIFFKQLGVMKGQLEEMKATTDSMRLDQRAWVVVKDVKFENELKVGEINRFSLTFINVGKTPAQRVRFKYTSRVHMSGKPDIVTPVPSDEYKDLSLGPGTKFVVSGNTLPPRLNQADVVGLESGSIVFTLSVEVTYQDVFREEKKKLHKTTYCGFYKPENKPDFTLCNSGNYVE